MEPKLMENKIIDNQINLFVEINHADGKIGINVTQISYFIHDADDTLYLYMDNGDTITVPVEQANKVLSVINQYRLDREHKSLVEHMKTKAVKCDPVSGQ
jgi:hypothetical protein